MATKRGICRNEECEMCGQVQEAEKSNFVCKECGRELMPFDGGGENKSKKWWNEHKRQVLLGAGALVVVGGGIWGGMSLMSGPEAKPVKPLEAPAPKPAPVPVDTVSIVDTAEVVTAEKPEVEEQKPEAAPEQSVKPVSRHQSAPQVQNGRGRVNLGYGIYEGDLKNGKPHGYGTITYTRQHQIVSSKDFVANPGDRFEGDFRDGRISGIGYWYHGGEQTAIKP